MKKIALLLVIILAVSTTSFADYRPSAGAVTLEVDFVPLSVNESPIQLNNIQGRYFLGSTTAVRVGLLLDILSQTETNTPDPGNLNNIDSEKTRIIEFGIAPGIEFHLPVGERVSPYVGAELGIWTRSSNYVFDNNYNNDKVTASGFDGFTSFGINFVAGVDAYLWKGLYVGAEFGLGFTRTTYPDFEETVTIGGTSQTETVPDNSVDIVFGNFARPALRLGWAF